MLRDILPEPDFQHLTRRGYLEVRSPSFPQPAVLDPGALGPVTVYEHGRPIMRLCIQCVERVPDHDTVAMHKLMIEGNEQGTCASPTGSRFLFLLTLSWGRSPGTPY